MEQIHKIYLKCLVYNYIVLIYNYLFKVFSMPILVIRGYQIMDDATNPAALKLVMTISRPLARYALFGSIYMTTVITFERYCGKGFRRKIRITFRNIRTI